MFSAALAACSGPSFKGDPLLEVANHTEPTRNRVAAVEAAKVEAASDGSRKAAAQRVFRDVAWTSADPAGVRLAVLKALIDDPDPKIAEDARATAKLLLPKERSIEVVTYLSTTAVQRGWTDCIPPLIRSYSRTPASIGWIGGVQEADRPERLAIQSLSGGRPVEQVVFENFLKPPELASTYGMDWAKRFRADAWDLLARLDVDGSMRVQMLAAQPDDGTDEVVLQIRRCVKELHAMPLTGDELKWMMSLVDPKKRDNSQWWEQTSKAIASCTDAARSNVLNIRHAEAIHWASTVHPQWLSASREELLSQLKERLAQRTIHQRNIESGKYRVSEALDHWESRLRWADLICILAIDDIVRQPQVVQALATQAELDRRDETTEYGGILTLKTGVADPRTKPAALQWVAMLYPPRPGQRQGDERFIASDDMIAASDLAMAHYHLHAQKEKNGSYAGPSPGDLMYAARSGRNCIVFTTLGGGLMDVDYYQPDGIVIDLGEIGSETKAAAQARP
jgi:hypothetical protein